MKAPHSISVGLLATLFLLAGAINLPAAKEDSPAKGALGVTLAEWQAMGIDARRAHLRAMPKEARRSLLQTLEASADRSVPAGRTSRVAVSKNPRPADRAPQRTGSERSKRLQQIIWDPSKLGAGPPPPGGADSGLTPPGIVRYDTGTAISFFGTGDHKGNRFDTKNGAPIPNSARFDRIGVLMVPSPPPMTTFLPFRDPLVNVKILGPAGTDLGGGNVLVGSGENILDVNPPLHFDGQPLHIAVQDLPGTTYTYSFDISGAVYFYGTFRFAYYRYYNTVLTYSFMTTLYFSSSYDLPFYATTLFGGAVPFPISSFTGLFGTIFYQYIPISRLVPVADSMTVNGQGFHGENVKSGGTITPIGNHNFGVWIIPVEIEVFSYDHELGTFGPWSSHVP